MNWGAIATDGQPPLFLTKEGGEGWGEEVLNRLKFQSGGRSRSIRKSKSPLSGSLPVRSSRGESDHQLQSTRQNGREMEALKNLPRSSAGEERGEIPELKIRFIARNFPPEQSRADHGPNQTHRRREQRCGDSRGRRNMAQPEQDHGRTVANTQSGKRDRQRAHN